MSKIREEFRKKTVKQLKCTNCGGEITVMAKRTNYVGCNFCGAVLDTNTDEYRIINQLQPPNDFPPKSFLRLGMIGKFFGKYYMIIGRTRWQSNYMEYWAEDGETGWDAETWEYDEWVLISEDSQYFYIIEDASGYAISRSYIPKFPNINQGAYIKDFDTGKNKQLLEYGGSNVLFFEGESTYQIKPGDAVHFGMYEKGKKDYIVESRLTKDGKIKEIEFFSETPVVYADMLKAFDDDDTVKSRMQEIKGKLNDLELKKKKRKSTANLFFIVCLATLLCFFYTLFNTGDNFMTQLFPCSDCGKFKIVSDKQQELPKQKQPVNQKQASLNKTQSTQENANTNTNATSIHPDSARTIITYESDNLISVDTKDRIFTINLSAKFLGETECFVILEILNDSNEVVQQIAQEFHYFVEEGSEDDYVDSNESESKDFQIDKNAAYKIRITTDMPEKDKDKISVMLTLNKASIMSSYFLILLIIFIVIWLVLFIRYKMTNTGKRIY